MHLPPEPSSIFALGTPKKPATSCYLHVLIRIQLVAGSYLFCLLKVSSPTAIVSEELLEMLAIIVHPDSQYLT